MQKGKIVFGLAAAGMVAYFIYMFFFTPQIESPNQDTLKRPSMQWELSPRVIIPKEEEKEIILN